VRSAADLRTIVFLLRPAHKFNTRKDPGTHAGTFEVGREAPSRLIYNGDDEYDDRG
jgi:hypothetical protein